MRFGKLHLIPCVPPREAWRHFQAAVSREIFWERENERSSPCRFWHPVHTHERTQRELTEARRIVHLWWEAMNRALDGT